MALQAICRSAAQARAHFDGKDVKRRDRGRREEREHQQYISDASSTALRPASSRSDGNRRASRSSSIRSRGSLLPNTSGGQAAAVVIDSARGDNDRRRVSTIKQRPGLRRIRRGLPIVRPLHEMALMVRSVSDRASTAAALRTPQRRCDVHCSVDDAQERLMSRRERRFSNCRGIAGIAGRAAVGDGLLALHAHAS